MGKASRRKRAQVVPLTHARSAWVAVRREVTWALKNPSSDYGATLNQAMRSILDHSELRVVKFPQSQAGVFREFGDDLLHAACDARPPFANTFYDFGFIRTGGYELAGATINFGRHRDGEEPTWTAFLAMRFAGTDDWSSAILDSKILRDRISAGGPLKSETIGPRLRPVTDRDDSDYLAVATRVLAGALTFLESANVELVDADPLPRGHQAHGIPHLEVIVKQNSKRYVYADDHQPQAQEWSHRWEVRGHFKHFRKGATFDKHPDRRVVTPDGDEFVRIWCPPHVKGPQDKPLVPKLRTVA